MLKEKRLKKRILINAGILSGFLVFICLIAFLVMSFGDSLSADKNKLQSENAGLMSENNAINEQMIKANNSLSLYEKIVRNNQGKDFNINRESAKTTFQKLKDKHQLALTGTNSFNQIVELTDEQFKKKTGIVVVSDAELNFGAISDETVFQFIDDLYKRLSGFVVITSLQINKTGNITSQTLVDISAGRFPSLVSASIKFKWIGLKPPAEKSDKVDSNIPAADGSVP